MREVGEIARTSRVHGPVCKQEGLVNGHTETMRCGPRTFLLGLARRAFLADLGELVVAVAGSGCLVSASP